MARRDPTVTGDTLSRASVGTGPGPIRPSARLRLMGSFGLTDRAGQTVPLVAPRAQSLIAFLALHRDVPQTRQRISFLLWPDSSEAQARNNLRQLIHQARATWPEAGRYLIADATTLSLRPGTDLLVDIDELEAAGDAAVAADGRTDGVDARALLERAVDLYSGDLLPDSYDDWVVAPRERLLAQHRRQLDRLIGLLEAAGDFRMAVEVGERRSRIDPLDERIYRWRMRLHALDQDRAGAIRVYQACCAVLERELGVEPEPATQEAYRRIVSLGPGADPETTVLDDIPAADAVVAPEATIPLIGRQAEWAQATAAARRLGSGAPTFLVISGEAGIGKSRLAAELVTWAASEGFRSAATRAYAAEGRLSYAPVADWLRSRAMVPLMPRLDPGTLSELARLVPELLTQRPDVPRPSTRIEDWQRQAFFAALAQAFLSGDQPLLLVLDDLQWCDEDTLGWLHFLLRVDRRADVLVVGTVRPDEVDRDHPLVGLMATLAESGRLTVIDLAPLDAAATARLAASVAGRALTREQATAILADTEGNPLFVVETVRARLTGAIPTAARPSSGGSPGHDRLPPRVRAVIAARLRQLSEPARELAAVAATVGRAFSLAVVRASSPLDEVQLVRGLDELLRRQIVRELGDDAYDFTHDKLREVADGELTVAHRRLLHRQVAEGLERVHAGGLDGVAGQIAAHYAIASLADRAATYYQLAAEVAQRIGANREAITLLHRGLGLLETVAASPDRDATELDLQTALGVSLIATAGYAAEEVWTVYARCRYLCQVLGRPPSPPILRGLALASLAQARGDECHALGDHLLSLADRADDPVLRVEAHFLIAAALLLAGAAQPARTHLEASLAAYDRSRSATHITRYGQDPAAVCLIRLSLDLWVLGEPEDSARRRAESLELAAQIGHPFTMGYVLTWDSILQCHRGDAAAARAQAEAAVSLSREHGTPFWRSIGTIVHGWAVAEEGDPEAGIAEMRKGMAAYKATGSLFIKAFQLGLLAEAHGRLGYAERGLTLIAEALAIVDRTNERWGEAELHRRKGDLLAQVAGDDGLQVEAEAAYRRAIEIARYQGTRALELRSATRLAALWYRHDRSVDARQLLEPLVPSFGQAADVPDLVLARSLLTGDAFSDRT